MPSTRGCRSGGPNRCRQELLTGGMPTGRIVARGFGESRPVAPNTTPDGADDPAARARNRRVEIVIENTALSPAAALVA